MESERQYQRIVIDKMMNAYALHEVIVDESNTPVDYRFVEVNPAFEAYTGLTGEQVIGKTIREINPDIEKDEVDWIKKYGDIALNDGAMAFESYSEAFKRFYAIHVYSPTKYYFVTIFQDISSLKQKEFELLKNTHELELVIKRLEKSEQMLRHRDEENNALIEELRAQFDALTEREAEIQRIAFYDGLTGILNRRGFERELARLQEEMSGQSRFCMTLISVTNAKDIYDTYGLLHGDHVLQEVAARMARSVDEHAMVGRLDSHIFAICFPDVYSDAGVQACVNQLSQALKTITVTDTLQVHLRVSIGMAFYPEDCPVPGELLTCAMAALAKGTKAVHDTVTRYTPHMTMELQRKRNIQSQLSKALSNQEFRLFFQPQFLAGSNALRGFEALIRWETPESGLVSPNYFIPFAEENGLIIPIGEWVLDEACRQAAEWKPVFGHSFIMSINVSCMQFMSSAFVERVARLVQELGLQNMLEIEITESVFIGEHKEAQLALRQLHDLGVKIALDDFGTGYSSFNYLKTLDLNTLKLDRSFIARIDMNANDEKIAACIIHMASTLGMETIAEGVEKEIQLTMLEKMGCTTIQGYYTGRPMPADEIVTRHSKGR